MLETLILFGFCFLVGLISLGVFAYLVMTGQILTLDGIALTIISLTIGGVFMLNVVWSAFTGELKKMLEQMRKKPESNEPSDKPPGEISS